MTTRETVVTAIVSGLAGAVLVGIMGNGGMMENPRATAATIVACAAIGVVNFARRRQTPPPDVLPRHKTGRFRD